MPSARRSWTSSSEARRALGAAVGLALLAVAAPAGPPVHAEIAGIAPVPGLSPGVAGGLRPLTLEYYPGEFGDLRQEVFIKPLFRGIGKVVRSVGRVVGEVAKGTVKATGEVVQVTGQIAQVPSDVGRDVGTEVGGFFGGILGGRRGRQVGKKLGGLAGEFYGGRIGSRSSLIKTVNRAGGKAEQIQEIAQHWSDQRDRIDKIFSGDIGGLAREEIERRVPGVIQEIRPTLPPTRPALPPMPPPAPVRVEGRR